MSSMLKYSCSSVSDSAVVELDVTSVALLILWTSFPFADINGAPERAASSDIFLCPGSLGLTVTCSCVGCGASESFRVTALCLMCGGDLIMSVGSAASRDSFLGGSNNGVGEGDSSRMAGGALRPLLGRRNEESFSFDFLIVTLFLTDCLQWTDQFESHTTQC